LESIGAKNTLLADKYKGLYIVTGGVLEPSLKTIGRDQVVPKQFYKIVLQQANSQYKMIAFLIPKSSEQPLFNYVVSVDLIEQKNRN
jgi:endonuclease G